MSDLRELYQQVIIDHSKHPRNFRKIEGCICADGFNPLCGDHFQVFVSVENGKIRDLSFEGAGCAISTASASMMTESLKSKTVEEAKKTFEKFHDLITGQGDPDAPELGKLAVFAGVCEFPARVKCASLAWHTMKNALEGRNTASTE